MSATGCATEVHVKWPGHGAAWEHIGYGAYLLPYLGSTTSYHDNEAHYDASELGTMPITEFTSISGNLVSYAREDDRIAAIDDGLCRV